MIIKKILIENYQCYYGAKKFNLVNGLNVLLGENGEGKTKFFEALQWLFTSEKGERVDDFEYLISKKALSNLQHNEPFKVKVEATIEQFGRQKILSKEFTVEKSDSDNKYEINNFVLKGTQEDDNGERYSVDGYGLLEEVFPREIQKYTMFKGEDELNIFDNEESLTGLVKLYSDAKYYYKYESRGELLKIAAEKAVDQASKNNSTNQSRYSKLERDIAQFTRDKGACIAFIEQLTSNRDKTKENVKNAEKYVDNAKALDIVSKRILNIQSEISRKESQIDESYTTSLLDEKWILMHFEEIHTEFANKISDFGKLRRKLQSNHDKEEGIKEGEKRANLNLLKDLIPLPIGTPSKAIMEEMIKEQFCKVCNREAPEGSESLAFMTKRLQQYLDAQKEHEKTEPEKLFKSNYISKLVYLSSNHEDSLSEVRNIPSVIEEWFVFNQERKEETIDLNAELELELQERSKIIGSSKIGSEDLDVVLKDYNSWQQDIVSCGEDLKTFSSNLEDLNAKLKLLEDEKDEIDLTNANRFLLNTRNILRNISTILNDTKNRKFDEFIIKLQNKSNEIFSTINVDAFTGVIVFSVNAKREKVKVQLQEENGDLFYSPNQSLLTSMHIAVLLAISELAHEVREEGYPLIFDAPTSSFGSSKMTEFINLIYKRENQTLILIKDYIGRDANKILIVKDEFASVKRKKAFWLRLERPFDEKKLETINTEIVEI
ncbi:AAA family ATPase [Chryseobacterium indoltheticum]|jgi:DNA sulfur modification protein DndD|uniref:AAA family ATPase n=1 Tax=Chryseobacterium indoltheticum TaxID=254 RepID=UPI00242BBB52|nr:AAA family ATPase [Chryseobacterium indoltheticum]MDF2833024.1 hypothetical protein [Chryseobacterium indoltheticum]